MTAAKPAPAVSPFRDLAEFVSEAPPIELPVRGVTYSFPGSISGWAYLLCQGMFAAAGRAASAGETLTLAHAATELAPNVEVLSDAQQRDLSRELFGAEHDRVHLDLDSRTITHMVVTLAAWHALGPEVAVQVWEAPGNRPAPNRATRRAGRKPAAKSTPSRGYTSGTTSGRRPTGTASPRRGSTSTGR